MLKYALRLLLIAIPILFCLLFSLSQKKEADLYHLLISESRQADSLYNAATSVSHSNYYDENKEQQLNKEALKLYENVFQKAPNNSQFDSLRFFCAFRIGELSHYFEQFQQALNGYQQAIVVKLKSSLPDSLLFKPYLYSGILYYNQNKFDTAADFFRKAERIQIEYNYGLLERERLFNTFGVLYFQKGDYKQAKNYFLKALEVLPKSHPFYKELYTNYNINLAQIYFKLENYDEANKIYQELLKLKDIDKNDINQNLGMINLYLGAPAKALNYFRNINYGRNYKLIFLYHNIGDAFSNLNQPDSAKKYFEKAIEINFTLGNNTDHIAYGQTLKSYGDLELQLHNTQEALKYYQSAIHQFYPAFSDSSVYLNPEKFSGVFSYINLFNVLSAKAQAFHNIYESTKSIENANHELDAYQSAFKLVDYVEKTYNSDEAILFLDKTKYAVHAKPIDIAFELYAKTKDKKFIEDLYFLDQQNKASVLSLKMQTSEAALGKDASLIFKESFLRSEITRLSLKAGQLNDSIKVSAINNEIRDHEIELGKIQDQISTSVAGEKIPSIHYLQDKFLDPVTTFISFHLSENKLTTTVITQKTLDCFQQNLPADFHEKVSAYVDDLKRPTSNKEGISKQLYSLLFGNLHLENIKRLIIVPDDELNYFAFESLKSKEGQYLVQKYSIQYQYSASLLKKESVDFSGHQTLSFAPFAHKGFSDSMFHFESLPNSYSEIKSLDGTKFTDTSATKQNFLSNLSKYKVLHLATHAVVNDKNDELSFIAFYPSSNNTQDHLLYSEEISNLPLKKTNLVILSACETAAGNLVKGEGVMSLSRAFAYGGCSNVITSLWNANDFSTAYLTSRVHVYLNKNYSIDQALRQSKLDYLNDKSINPRLKNPFYWSHLIFIGNYSPAQSSNYWWIVYLGVAILIITVLVLKIIKPYKSKA
ncbi:MAG TPA: CHAT domain-containing protein [Flavisolibacter sp.]|nr:CHAT domain-containing protein [Flavisolibacter sp.]